MTIDHGRASLLHPRAYAYSLPVVRGTSDVPESTDLTEQHKKERAL